MNRKLRPNKPKPEIALSGMYNEVSMPCTAEQPSTFTLFRGKESIVRDPVRTFALLPLERASFLARALYSFPSVAPLLSHQFLK